MDNRQVNYEVFPLHMTEYELQQHCRYRHPDRYGEDVEDLHLSIAQWREWRSASRGRNAGFDGGMGGALASSTVPIKFVLTGDQNAGKTSFLYKLSTAANSDNLRLSSLLPLLSASFTNSRLLNSGTNQHESGGLLSVARDEGEFLDTDVAQCVCVLSAGDFAFLTDEFDITPQASFQRFATAPQILKGAVTGPRSSTWRSQHATKRDCAPETAMHALEIGEKCAHVALNFCEFGGDHLDRLKSFVAGCSATKVCGGFDQYLGSRLEQSAKDLGEADCLLYFINCASLFCETDEWKDSRIVYKFDDDELKNCIDRLCSLEKVTQAANGGGSSVPVLFVCCRLPSKHLVSIDVSANCKCFREVLMNGESDSGISEATRKKEDLEHVGAVELGDLERVNFERDVVWSVLGEEGVDIEKEKSKEEIHINHPFTDLLRRTVFRIFGGCYSQTTTVPFKTESVSRQTTGKFLRCAGSTTFALYEEGSDNILCLASLMRLIRSTLLLSVFARKTETGFYSEHRNSTSESRDISVASDCLTSVVLHRILFCALNMRRECSEGEELNCWMHEGCFSEYLHQVETGDLESESLGWMCWPQDGRTSHSEELKEGTGSERFSTKGKDRRGELLYGLGMAGDSHDIPASSLLARFPAIAHALGTAAVVGSKSIRLFTESQPDSISATPYIPLNISTWSPDVRNTNCLKAPVVWLFVQQHLSVNTSPVFPPTVAPHHVRKAIVKREVGGAMCPAIRFMYSQVAFRFQCFIISALIHHPAFLFDITAGGLWWESIIQKWVSCVKELCELCALKACSPASITDTYDEKEAIRVGNAHALSNIATDLYLLSKLGATVFSHGAREAAVGSDAQLLLCSTLQLAVNTENSGTVIVDIGSTREGEQGASPSFQEVVQTCQACVCNGSNVTTLKHPARSLDQAGSIQGRVTIYLACPGGQCATSESKNIKSAETPEYCVAKVSRLRDHGKLRFSESRYVSYGLSLSSGSCVWDGVLQCTASRCKTCSTGRR